MATINLGRVGFVQKGAYSGVTTYKINDVVVYNNGVYACISPTTGNLPTNTTYWKLWLDQSTLVAKTGDETIAGVKTFSSSPIVPTPTTGTQAANKTYADTKQSKSELAYDAGTSSYIPNTLSSGAVIERGSNDNGEYVKFADGTLICTTIIMCSGYINIQLGSLYTTPSTTWNFPATFNTSYFHLSGCERFGVGNCFLSRADGANETASSCSFKGVRGLGVNMAPAFALTAIGRWK